MNPLAIIGSVAGVAGVAAVTFLGQQMFFGFVDMLRAEFAADFEKQGVAYERQVDVIKQDAKEENEAKNDIIDENARIYAENINERDEALAIQMGVDPNGTDLEHMRDFFIIMCETRNFRREDARSYCAVRAADSGPSTRTPFVSITPKTVRFFTDACKRGIEGACNYRIVGIRTGPLTEMKTWANEMKALVQKQDADLATMRQQIIDITNIPEPTITKE